MKIIDYDKIEEWEAELDAIISEIIPQEFYNELQAAKHEFSEDAGNMLSNLVGIENLTNHLCERLSEFNVRFYHGTRLTDSEFVEIHSHGLVPLDIGKRKSKLEEILKSHPAWDECCENLDKIIGDVVNDRFGRREDGCVHACISRIGLLKGANHYLRFGAEVDDCIIRNLFRRDRDVEIALSLLNQSRKAALISFLYPFRGAMEAANFYGISNNSLPFFLEMFISAWTYKKSNPSFKTTSLKICSAAIFRGAIQIEDIEIIQDEEIN